MDKPLVTYKVACDVGGCNQDFVRFYPDTDTAWQNCKRVLENEQGYTIVSIEEAEDPR